MQTRTLAQGLAANRVLFGLGFLLRPQAAGPSWIGRAARQPGTQVITRAQGARDVALGLGALRALAAPQRRDAWAWLAGHAIADGADLAATWAARDALPRSSRTIALTFAAGSVGVAAWSAAGVRP